MAPIDRSDPWALHANRRSPFAIGAAVALGASVPVAKAVRPPAGANAPISFMVNAAASPAPATTPAPGPVEAPATAPAAAPTLTFPWAASSRLAPPVSTGVDGRDYRDHDMANDADTQTSSQSFPPAAQQQPTANAFGGFSPAPPSGGFNFSAGPASNPFASQAVANNNSAGSNTGSNAFSSSFTFGSNQSGASNPSGANNPFGSIASASPASNAFGNTESAGAPSNSVFSSSSAPLNNPFGGNSTSSAPSSNLFGASSTQQNAFASKPSDSSNNLFTNNSSGSTNVFGANPSATSGNIFGSTSSAAPASNLFAAAAPSAPSSTSFGAATSSAAPSTIFGAVASSSPSTNMFAGLAKNSDATSQPQTGNAFGGTTTSGPSASAFGGTAVSSASSSNLFGGNTSSAPSPNLFDNMKTSSTPSTSAFGGATSSAPSNIFGSIPASSALSGNIFGKSGTSSAPATTLFGAATSNTSSAPVNASNAPSAGPAGNIFSNPTPSSGSAESASQTANLFAQTAASSTPPSGSFNFGGQPGAKTSSAANEQSNPATSGPKQSSASNPFPPASAAQPSTSGAGIFNFPAQSPAKTATDATPFTGFGKDTSGNADSQAKPAANMFAPSTSNATPKLGSTLFGSTSESPSQTSTNLFNFQSQRTSNEDAQKHVQNSTETQASSTSNLFAKAASGGPSESATTESPGQTASPKQDKLAESTRSSNPFSSITPSTTSLTGPAASPFKVNGAPSAQESSSDGVGSPVKPNASPAQTSEATSTAPAAPDFDMSKIDVKKVEMIRKVRCLNRWMKMKASTMSETDDFAAIAQVYLKFFVKHTSAYFDARPSAQAQFQTKSNGKRKADDEPEAGSPKKSKVPSSQDDSNSAGASNTANVFNSLINKPAQSPLRNVESATSPDAEAGPSSNNVFGASASSPFNFNPNGGMSGSTTPIGSPAKPGGFSQSPIKAPTFGQVGATEKTPSAKRRSEEISSDEQEEESQDDTTQNDKRQKTSTPVSSADTGSVLNSRQASPDARNPFGNLSQEESNKDGDDEDGSEEEETVEQGSTTPTATPKRVDGLFGRITKDDIASNGDPKTPDDGGIFGRITGTSTDNSKPAAANPFGFPASSYELPGGAKTGPVLKTWNGDAASPIKFGTSQPAASDDGKKEATPSASSNPFSGIATGNSSASAPLFKFTPAPTPPAGDASPFKFNPPAATPSGTSSVFASGFGSRATTPGVSTGASENETSAAENDDDEESQTVDNEQVALHTALTDEDKKTYEVLFDTDIQPVTLMHLVDRSEDELKAEPKKGAKKWESKGKGPVRVLKHKESGGVSILFKAEPMGRVLINTRVQPSFHYKKAKAKFATFPLPDEKGKITPQYLKFEDDADCAKFVDVCESSKSS
ncbi:proteophosphoglycan 5 [Diplodia corticola]|uniref:Proteophosphoglycan 5 n=1 Tax=Diplodia corticola TaxID=236234 RepID=A0A1J9R5H7_9PEZI|nr:proteophosphoglycan 5 [Diplodia corticola]OJD35809.1 proteophosphoglycan 5 [Diplodia corticola]